MLEEPQERIVSTPIQLQTKQCPFCAEEILASAAKCKHCGSMLPETNQAGLSAQAIQQMSSETKFTPLPNETILIEGLSSYLKSTFNIMSCDAFLTNYRLVFCNKGMTGAGALAGVVGMAVALAHKSTKITFQVPISEIKSVTKGKRGFGSKYTVETRFGTQYVVQFTKEDSWVSTMETLGIKCIV